jgi:NAD+ synthase (glutamine-hydrolysing)
MRSLHVGAAVLNQVPLDWRGNAARVTLALDQARDAGVRILCLPEMCLTGYGCEDMFLSPDVHRRALDSLHELLPRTAGMVACFGLPLAYNNAVFNSVALCCDGAIAGFVAKRFLAGDGIHYEPRWFKAWAAGVHTEVDVEGARYPLGDLHFDCDGVRIGFEICEDAWVAVRPGGAQALKGVDVILNPSASHFAFGKLAVRERFVVEGSRAFSVTYVYTNLVGNEAGRAIYDGGALIAASGRLLARGPRFSFQDVHVTTAVSDLDLTRGQQMRTASFRPEVDGDERDRVRCAFSPVDVSVAPGPAVMRAITPNWEYGEALKHEEFTRAEALALFDYMRKSRSRGFVVSLSGGADSSATATLVRLMVRLAIEELGWDGVRAKLDYLGLPATPDEAGLVAALLTCVYQATRNSGPVTTDAARSLAEALGATFYLLDVDALVGAYTGLVEGAVERPLTWETDDIALQNIQARVRGPSVWMLANLGGKLLLSTSNRSEAAVGYATMDGDTCGGLSPIAGIDKAFLRQWLRWVELEGPVELGPLPVLGKVNGQAPTAELRPPAEGQTDEADLMPYPLLDAVERAAIRDKRPPVECYQLMRQVFPDLAPRQLEAWVARFFVLWSRNQWKRERYAPSFHLDDENLDPKTWCRFPILSGGFEVELAALRAFVDAEVGA